MIEKKTRQVIRCPVCGKLNKPVNFQAGEKGEHRLEILTHFVSSKGDKGIINRWERTPFNLEWLKAMRRLLKRVLYYIDIKIKIKELESFIYQNAKLVVVQKTEQAVLQDVKPQVCVKNKQYVIINNIKTEVI